MDEAARNKALDKIRKCMALSRSSNEHEAAAALRQAQALMRKYGLEEDDVAQVEYLSCLVVARDYEYGKRKPLMLSSVVSVVMTALGVKAVWEWHVPQLREPRTDYERLNPMLLRGRPVHAIRYFGPRSRVFLAEHAHSVVYRAVGKAWSEFRARRFAGLAPPRGARASFYAGWCSQVLEKVQALVVTSEEEARIQKAKERQYGGGYQGKPAPLGTKKTFDSIVSAGALAGSDFEMNRPLGEDRLRLEKL